MPLTEKFKKSSSCGYTGRCWYCVEVAMQDGDILVRDSKNLEQAALRFNKQEWDAFIKGVKNGEFDL